MIRIDPAPKLDYSQVMLVPRYSQDGPSSRNSVYLKNKDYIIPVIAANMDGVGTFEMARELCRWDLMTALQKHYTLEELLEFYLHTLEEGYTKNVVYSMGINQPDLIKWKNFYEELTARGHVIPTVCVDVANGYTEATADAIRWIKSSFNTTIMAGNVVTREGVFRLAEAGANIIKIGVGPGSVCTTRKLTGTGYPQFSAVLECVQAAKAWVEKFPFPITHGPRVMQPPKIVADGGITCPGDVAKAFAAGADYVMIGGMFAGHDEGGGTPCDALGNEKYIQGATGTIFNYAPMSHRKFYGMASKCAQDKHNGGVAEYRASEGKEVVVPYRGKVSNTVKELLGGLRSACAYQGCQHLEDISSDVQFIQVANQTNNIFGAS
jgi:GMP reductase